jgi:hypothetical protein
LGKEFPPATAEKRWFSRSKHPLQRQISGALRLEAAAARQDVA